MKFERSMETIQRILSNIFNPNKKLLKSQSFKACPKYNREAKNEMQHIIQWRKRKEEIVMC